MCSCSLMHRSLESTPAPISTRNSSYSAPDTDLISATDALSVTSASNQPDDEETDKTMDKEVVSAPPIQDPGVSAQSRLTVCIGAGVELRRR